MKSAETHLLILTTMRIPSKFILAASFGILSAGAAEEECCGNGAGGAVFRDAATHDDLARVVAAKVDPIVELPVAVVTEEAKAAEPQRPKSIIERSEILNSSGVVTLVPKRAVIHIPPSLSGTLGWPQGAKLVRWEEFFRNNRSWIRTVEVTRSQAEGLSPLPQSVIESFAKSSQLIVATYQGGPISVMPLQAAAEPSPEASETQATPSNP